MVARSHHLWVMLVAYGAQLGVPLWHAAEHAEEPACAACRDEAAALANPALHAECDGACGDPQHHHHHAPHETTCLFCQAHAGAAPHVWFAVPDPQADPVRSASHSPTSGAPNGRRHSFDPIRGPPTTPLILQIA